MRRSQSELWSLPTTAALWIVCIDTRSPVWIPEPMNRYIGLLVIVGGLCLVFFGLLIYTGALSWFGRLPGDVRYEGEQVRVYVPIVSMLILSLVLSLIFYLLRRFF